ncbi:spore germination protein [Cohnella hongkongensis]|uniref:Spore germination protein n=1 Tax=Cohnella hongkongensis TaxID=178337 RepID=A0ABV9FB87_9BACL
MNKHATEERQRDDACISPSMQDNINHVRSMLGDPADLVVRSITVGGGRRDCTLVFLTGLSDKKVVDELIVRQILLADRFGDEDSEAKASDLLDDLRRETMAVSKVIEIRHWNDVLRGILYGDTVLFLEGADQALLVGTGDWKDRNVEEPPTEALVRGPREGFTEKIETNVALIRRGIRDVNLRLVSYSIGRRSRKTLVMAYIQGIIHPGIVEEVRRRLDTIDIDDAPESGFIEQWIEDSFLSPFPQLLHTERPDKVRASLLQGKVAIMLEGTPFALILPTTFVSLIQSPEDYYERWLIGSLIRLLRYLAVFISLFLPAIYIALVSFHQGMIPFKLAFSIAASREGVPFPAVIEALLMEGTLELLREAGIRLPKPIGQTIGIVGGLVIGEAAVQAGVVSPIMVIVVAVTAISSFATPSYSAGIAFRMLRFATMLAAGVLGLFGIILSFIMISTHLVRLKSFGMPYATPFAPMFMKDWRDLVIRSPVTFLTRRPDFMQTKNVNRASGRGKRT